jgi:hypothetical protein
MSCDEGQRLSALFLQATMAMKDLEGQVTPTKDRQVRKQEIESARQFQDDCKHDLTEHARLCPSCGPKE